MPQTVSFAARTGLIWNLGAKSYFSDRFQLGGPVSVRMFRMNGMGPHDGGKRPPNCSCPCCGLMNALAVDSLGGSLYWSTGVSLISDIPRKPHWPVKTHLFLNAGRLDNVDKCKYFHAASPLFTRAHTNLTLASFQHVRLWIT